MPIGRQVSSHVFFQPCEDFDSQALIFIVHGSKECPRNQQCFSGAMCGKSFEGDSNSAIIIDETAFHFFCGSSWGDLIKNCGDAIPCPSGTNAGEY